MLLGPLLDLGLSQAQDVLSGVGRFLATADMQEIQTLGSLVQILFVTSGIAHFTERVSLDQGCGLGIIFLLADDLPPFESTSYVVIIHVFVWKSSIK